MAAASARTSIPTTSSCCRPLGRRRWRIGRAAKARLRDDVPLKMLADFVPSEEWILEPGDMLYLPPGWGHDGVALGECITASIGFRAPRSRELAIDVVQRLAEAARDDADPSADGPRYRDAGAPVADRPARIPESLQRFAAAALERLLADRVATSRALGEVLSEPKPGTWFERAEVAVVPAPTIALRSPHPHALRRALRLRQRRGVPRRRTRCDTACASSPTGAGSTRRASPARASRPESCSQSG